MRLLLCLASLLVLILFSCKNSESSEALTEDVEEVFRADNKVAEQKLKLVSSGSIEIPIDSTSLNYSPYPLYYENDTCEYYVTVNEFLSAVDFYDLKKRMLVKRNVYASSGPDGIYSPRRMYIKSLDSIYMYSDADQKIFLTNFQGQILAKYRAAKPWMAHLMAPFTVIDTMAYFPYMTFGDNRAQVGFQTVVRQGLVSGEYSEIGPPYPSIYNGKMFYNFTPDYTFGHADNIVVRFGALTTMYNYDLRTDSTTSFQMKSMYQEGPVKPNYTAKEFKDLDDDYEGLEQDCYLGVKYDKYNHVYYSIFQKGVPIHDVDGNKNQPIVDKPFYVIIFNEKFEYCGETELGNHLYHNNFIPTKQGLLVVTANPKNPKNDESILRFDVFKVVPAN